MRILVTSDTHGRPQIVLPLVEMVRPDRIIHLGDVVEDAIYLEEKTGLPVDYVSGNNDFGYDQSLREKVIEIEGQRLFLTHGHRYHVSYDPMRLVLRAKELDASFALFGHTHRYLDETVSGVHVLNPGSPVLPRDGEASAMLIEGDELTQIIKLKI